jgi:hypothetical protein
VQRLPPELQQRITAHLDAPSIAHFEACFFGRGNRPQLWSHLAAPLMAVLPESAQKAVPSFLAALDGGVPQAALEQMDEPARLAILDIALKLPSGCLLQAQLLDASFIEVLVRRALHRLTAMIAEYPSPRGAWAALQERLINLTRAVECLPRPLTAETSQAAERALAVLGTLRDLLAPQSLTPAQQSRLVLPADLLEEIPMGARAHLRAYLQPLVPGWTPVYGQVMDLEDWRAAMQRLYTVATEAVGGGSQPAIRDLDEQLQKYQSTCALLQDGSNHWLKYSVDLTGDVLTNIKAVIRQDTPDTWERRRHALRHLEASEDRSKRAFEEALYAYHLDSGA